MTHPPPVSHPIRPLRGPCRPGRPRRTAFIAVIAGLALIAAGCGGGVDTFSMPNPPATTVAPPAPPDTLPPGLAAVTEAPVQGVTTTTVPAIGPGPASLNGTVTGPNGPVAGATVEIDRFVAYAFATARTTTAADGTWSFRNIQGGDYRVRAWQPPTLDMATPDTLFLDAGHPQTVTLQLASYQGQQVQVAINPAGPVLDQPANLVIQVTSPSVDPDGVLTSPPVSGTPVTLVDGPDWQVENGNPLTTDASGQVTFQVTCKKAGNDPLSAQVGSGSPVTLQMPACAPTPPPTTTTSTTSTSTTTPAFSTTTCPPQGNGNGNATTTTLTFGQC